MCELRRWGGLHPGMHPGGPRWPPSTVGGQSQVRSDRQPTSRKGRRISLRGRLARARSYFLALSDHIAFKLLLAAGDVVGAHDSLLAEAGNQCPGLQDYHDFGGPFVCLSGIILNHFES